jgi:GGDEF domain-containing protein
MPIRYKASPTTVKDGRIYWNRDSSKTDPAKFTARGYLLYRKHNRAYPAPGIMDYCNEGSKPLKFFRSWLDRKGTLVFNISEKQRQRMLPGKDAKMRSIIQPLPCESIINLGKFHQYNIIQTFCLISKVFFEMLFRKSIWEDISAQLPEPQSELYITCLESRELAEYMLVPKNQERVKKYIKEAFRKYKIKTADIHPSDAPDLVTYYRSLNPRDGSATSILMTFDEVVDSLGWFGDIIQEVASASNIQVKGAGITSIHFPKNGVRRNENRSYIPVLLEFTYENKISRTLDILYNDLSAINHSPVAEAFRQYVILISSNYKELSRLNDINRIKDKTFLKERHKIRASLLKLIAKIRDSEILDQLERNSRSGKPSNLDHRTVDRITSLKEHMARYNWTHLSCIIIDVDDYTILSHKYPGHVAPRVLTIIDRHIFLFLSNDKAGKFTKGYKYIYDNIGRDKYVILVTLPEDAAWTLANRLCRSIAEIDWTALARGMRVTCSGGVAEWRFKAEAFRECIIHATAGLFEAKITRKNSVHKGQVKNNLRYMMRELRMFILSFLFSLKLLILFISVHFSTDWYFSF